MSPNLIPSRAAFATLTLVAIGCGSFTGEPPANILDQAHQAAQERATAETARRGSGPRIEPEQPPAIVANKPETPLIAAESPRIRAKSESPLSETAADALARIGTGAVPQVTAALRDPTPSHRHRAAKILAQIGPDAKASVRELIVLLEDDDPEVRRAAAHALGQIGPGAVDAVPALLKAAMEDTAAD